MSQGAPRAKAQMEPGAVLNVDTLFRLPDNERLSIPNNAKIMFEVTTPRQTRPAAT